MLTHTIRDFERRCAECTRERWTITFPWILSGRKLQIFPTEVSSQLTVALLSRGRKAFSDTLFFFELRAKKRPLSMLSSFNLNPECDGRGTMDTVIMKMQESTGRKSFPKPHFQILDNGAIFVLSTKIPHQQAW